jgi:hypothetical protein
MRSPGRWHRRRTWAATARSCSSPITGRRRCRHQPHLATVAFGPGGIYGRMTARKGSRARDNAADQRVRPSPGGRAAGQPLGRAARVPRADGDEEGLRPGRVRRLHGARRGRAHPFLWPWRSSTRVGRSRRSRASIIRCRRRSYATTGCSAAIARPARSARRSGCWPNTATERPARRPSTWPRPAARTQGVRRAEALLRSR